MRNTVSQKYKERKRRKKTVWLSSGLFIHMRKHPQAPAHMHTHKAQIESALISTLMVFFFSASKTLLDDGLQSSPSVERTVRFRKAT